MNDTNAISTSYSYLPEGFTLTDWASLEPFYTELAERELPDLDALKRWISDRNELSAVVSENFAWRYIRISQDSQDKAALEAYQFVVQEISPKIAPFEQASNIKLVEHPLLDQLPAEEYGIALRSVKNSVALYREENIALSTEESLKAKGHGELFSQMSVEHEGETLTLQQAGTKLEETDRALRETMYRAINDRVAQDSDALETLFDELLALRQQKAKNAGFDNYRDYKFQAMGRFDYSVDDCFAFHDAIAEEIVPLVAEMHRRRQETMGLETLRPWDLSVDPAQQAPLKPFQGVEDLLEKSQTVLADLHPFFGESLATMRQMQHLDLDSRPGKRPGGYNMPLQWTGVPFVFMNSADSANDMRTMLHESGHAVHSFLMQGLPLHGRHIPSEIAELAAMSMELITMDRWSVFFDSEADLQRAKLWQLESALKILPWIAQIDAFQHWLYTHPGHSRDERLSAWRALNEKFSTGVVDRSGLEGYDSAAWYRQLHLFEVPFYYIEYGFAQLGAIALWRRFRENPTQAVDNYISALKLGYTQPIGDVYAAANIKFDFSPAYVNQLSTFVAQEIHNQL